MRLKPRWRPGGIAATAAASLALLLGACQPQPEPEAPVPTPEWPAFDYEEAARLGRAVYRLDTERSRVDVVVRSDGPLARFGHDHAVAVAAPEGYLLLGGRPGTAMPQRAELRFDLRNLRVDPPDARERYGLESEMSDADVRGTRRNLQERVLEPGGPPWVTLAMDDFRTESVHASAIVAITLQGQRFSQRQPFRMQIDEGQVTVEGNFALRHSDLGLTPYTAFGGSLRVADQMEIHFSLIGAEL